MLPVSLKVLVNDALVACVMMGLDGAVVFTTNQPWATDTPTATAKTKNRPIDFLSMTLPREIITLHDAAGER